MGSDELDYYAILEVTPSAPSDEIKRAFRAKARQFHPDLNPHPQAAAQFALVTQAYDVLSSAFLRAEYDRRMGYITPQPAPHPPPPPEPDLWEKEVPPFLERGMEVLRRLGLLFTVFFGLMLALVFTADWAAARDMAQLAGLLRLLLVPTVAAGVIVPAAWVVFRRRV
jgi:preprotein translocase subunit Sec63